MKYVQARLDEARARIAELEALNARWEALDWNGISKMGLDLHEARARIAELEAERNKHSAEYLNLGKIRQSYEVMVKERDAALDQRDALTDLYGAALRRIAELGALKTVKVALQLSAERDEARRISDAEAERLLTQGFSPGKDWQGRSWR